MRLMRHSAVFICAIGLFAGLSSAQRKARCDPGPCSLIPGLVFNPENNQCAWPDEMGCSLNDLGYRTSCRKHHAYALKPLDFKIRDLPSGHKSEQE